MNRRKIVSPQTRRNWFLVALLVISGILVAITSIYFLYLPNSGYQGGRNPYYNLVILFTRHTWEDIHTWAGIAMILVAILHFVLHWSWVMSMTRRMLRIFTPQGTALNPRGKLNLGLNGIVVLSFLLSALSGIYFFFAPHGRETANLVFIFTRTTWDLIHTWAGVTLIAAAVLHLYIHWKWLTKVTASFVKSFLPGESKQTPAAVELNK